MNRPAPDRDDVMFAAFWAGGLAAVASGAYLVSGRWKASALAGWSAAALVFGAAWLEKRG